MNRNIFFPDQSSFEMQIPPNKRHLFAEIVVFLIKENTKQSVGSISSIISSKLIILCVNSFNPVNSISCTFENCNFKNKFQEAWSTSNPVRFH